MHLSCLHTQRLSLHLCLAAPVAVCGGHRTSSVMSSGSRRAEQQGCMWECLRNCGHEGALFMDSCMSTCTSKFAECKCTQSSRLLQQICKLSRAALAIALRLAESADSLTAMVTYSVCTPAAQSCCSDLCCAAGSHNHAAALFFSVWSFSCMVRTAQSSASTLAASHQ